MAISIKRIDMSEALFPKARLFIQSFNFGLIIFFLKFDGGGNLVLFVNRTNWSGNQLVFNIVLAVDDSDYPASIFLYRFALAHQINVKLLTVSAEYARNVSVIYGIC